MDDVFKVDKNKLAKIIKEFTIAIKPILTNPEYNILDMGLGLTNVLAAFSNYTLDTKDLNEQKQIAHQLGRALEAQIMTNYTGDPEYKIER